MKLVRLYADNTNEFNNTFNADFTLKPNSQIALLNGNFQKADKELVINSQNDTLSYSIGTYTKTTDALTHQTVNKNNFKSFVTNIENVLKTSLSVSDSDVTGMTWDVRYNDKGLPNKVRIDTDYGVNTDPFGAMEKDDVIDVGNNIYQKSDGSSEGTPNAALFYPDNNLQVAFDGENGCGFFRFTLNELSAGGDGCYIGLSTLTGDEMGGTYTFNTSKVKFGIYAQNKATNYKTITIDDGLQTSALAVENATANDNDNDVLCIEGNLGKIRLVVYNDSNPAGVVLKEEEYSGVEELYPIVGFYDENDVSIRRLRFTPHPLGSNTLTVEDKELKLKLNRSLAIVDVGEGTPQPPTQTAVNRGDKTPMIFNFPDKEFAEFLGFTSDSIDVSPDDIFRLKSNNSVYLFDTSESYIIELMNLKVMSYDGLLQQRKNILQVVQNGRDSTQPDFIYQTNTPIFLDLDNAFPIQLRNIECRIVNSDYENVDIQGEANLTILFKDKNEN